MLHVYCENALFIQELMEFSFLGGGSAGYVLLIAVVLKDGVRESIFYIGLQPLNSYVQLYFLSSGGVVIIEIIFLVLLLGLSWHLIHIKIYKFDFQESNY